MGPFCVIINLDILCRFDSKHLEVTIHFIDLKCMKYVVPKELLAKAKAKKSEKPLTLHKGYAPMDCLPMLQKLWDLVLRVKKVDDIIATLSVMKPTMIQDKETKTKRRSESRHVGVVYGEVESTDNMDFPRGEKKVPIERRLKVIGRRKIRLSKWRPR
ncbi:hypothetical protein ACFE04_002177 [Oxalis oulophora]